MYGCRLAEKFRQQAAEAEEEACAPGRYSHQRRRGIYQLDADGLPVYPQPGRRAYARLHTSMRYAAGTCMSLYIRAQNQVRP